MSFTNDSQKDFYMQDPENLPNGPAGLRISFLERSRNTIIDYVEIAFNEQDWQEVSRMANSLCELEAELRGLAFSRGDIE